MEGDVHCSVVYNKRPMEITSSVLVTVNHLG